MLGRLFGALDDFLGITRRREQGDRELLRQLCFGDDEAARRLIALELSRSPGISEGTACRRAIRRCRRDNR